MIDNALILEEEKREEKEEKEADYYRKERQYGSIYRRIPLPCEIKGDTVDAKYKNGVLTVTLPKAPEAEAHRKRIVIHS